MGRAARRIPRKSPRRCCIGCYLPPQTRAISCSIPSSAPVRQAPAPGRLGGGGAAVGGVPASGEAATERPARVRPLSPSALETARSKRGEPRIPFGTIVELGILEPGITLTDERGRVRAEAKAEGPLSAGG